MDVQEAIALIEPAFGSQNASRIWADLGCGTGVFTRALASLLPSGSRILAVDRQPQRLGQITGNNVAVLFQQGDFENEALHLQALDGILMANSFHYIADKALLINKLENYFSAEPVFLIVEYNTSAPNRWVPYPISFQEAENFFRGLGYSTVDKLNMKQSAYGGEMYAALICR